MRTVSSCYSRPRYNLLLIGARMRTDTAHSHREGRDFRESQYPRHPSFLTAPLRVKSLFPVDNIV